MQVEAFTFNPFQENTYVVYDDSGECVIIDPGCSNPGERQALDEFISSQKLKPVKLLNTHAHIDHILGNSHVAGRYKLGLEMHQADAGILRAAPAYGEMWGVRMDPSPEPSELLDEGDTVSFGTTLFKVLFTPGHSPGSICFYSEKDMVVIAGDVLFYESIGRTDLPGGDYETLISSIRNKLFTLPPNVTVYPGHGPSTTIAHEIRNNPFLQN